MPHLGDLRGAELDDPQKALCAPARKKGEDDPDSGATIFPNDDRKDTIGLGTTGVYKANERILFSLQGCIDYAYGPDLHGDTVFRLILGTVVHGQWAGLPFIPGAPVETPTNVPGGLTESRSDDFEAATDPGGGNYAK
jgi:hypothetical protein